LERVMQRVGRALSGDAEAGDRIFSLQTSFGGGKTHSLVTLWHIAKHADKIRKSADCAAVREVLGDSFPAKVKESPSSPTRRAMRRKAGRRQKGSHPDIVGRTGVAAWRKGALQEDSDE